MQIVQCEDTVTRLEQIIHDSRQSTDKIQKEYNHLNEKVLKLHHDLEEQIHTNTQLLAENSQKQVELKTKDEGIAALKVACPLHVIAFARQRSLRVGRIRKDGESEGDC